jgi:hypothetical protein
MTDSDFDQFSQRTAAAEAYVMVTLPLSTIL